MSGSVWTCCLLTPHPQVSYGLHELLRNNAANIHSKEDWNVIFTLLEVVGAGASPDISSGGADEDSGQGGTDDEKVGRERGGSGGWVDLGRDGGAHTQPGAGYSIVHTRQIVMHCSVSYLKCCETLSFLVRDVVHITPENFSSCVAAIRTFVEASYRYDGGWGQLSLTCHLQGGESGCWGQEAICQEWGQEDTKEQGRVNKEGQD